MTCLTYGNELLFVNILQLQNYSSHKACGHRGWTEISSFILRGKPIWGSGNGSSTKLETRSSSHKDDRARRNLTWFSHPGIKSLFCPLCLPCFILSVQGHGRSRGVVGRRQTLGFKGYPMQAISLLNLNLKKVYLHWAFLLGINTPGAYLRRVYAKTELSYKFMWLQSEFWKSL